MAREKGKNGVENCKVQVHPCLLMVIMLEGGEGVRTEFPGVSKCVPGCILRKWHETENAVKKMRCSSLGNRNYYVVGLGINEHLIQFIF